MLNYTPVRMAALAAVVALAACSGKDEATATGSDATRTTTAPATRPAPPPPQTRVEPQQIQPKIDPQAELRKQTTIYFEFDSAELSRPARDVVQAHADYLIANPGLRVRLEGHTDERGTREYNLALGERRAQTVRQLMLLRGVSAAQVSETSFGEEQPVDLGHTESAWAQNRRVEINYR